MLVIFYGLTCIGVFHCLPQPQNYHLSRYISKLTQNERVSPRSWFQSAHAYTPTHTQTVLENNNKRSVDGVQVHIASVKR